MKTNCPFRFLGLFCTISLWVWAPLSVGQSIYRTDYKRSPAISDQQGKPRNVQTRYFPAERFIDSSYVNVRVPKDQINDSMRTDPRYVSLPGGILLERKIQTRPDSFKLAWFSYDLYKLQEPVLYNYPLNKEVYRLTWLRSFHPPVVVSMEKQGNKIQLSTKLLTQIPKLPGHRYADRNGTLSVADTSARIPFRLNKVKRISKADYEEFTQLIDKLKVLHASPLGFRNSFGTDGSNWILETHRPDGYYFFTKWSPDDDQPIRILGDYLLNLSHAKKERRY